MSKATNAPSLSCRPLIAPKSGSPGLDKAAPLPARSTMSSDPYEGAFALCWAPGPSELPGRPGEFEAVYGQFAKWNEFSLVFQLKLPLLGMYSLAYQNVQSFWGSIDKLL